MNQIRYFSFLLSRSCPTQCIGKPLSVAKRLSQHVSWLPPARRKLTEVRSQALIARICLLGFLVVFMGTRWGPTLHAQGVEQIEELRQIPPARQVYMGRRIAQTMSYHGAPWLIRNSREEEERPSQVLKQLDLRPGMVVCDMGCGNGFYALKMAEKVAPGGKVLAVDIQSEMLRLLQARAEQAGVDNVEPILGTLVDPHLPENSVDLVLMVDVYHEFSHPELMLAGIRRGLKADGLIALLEYREEDPRVPIKPLHKMSKRQILKEYRANGFRLAKQYDGLPWQHLMYFEKDPDWDQSKHVPDDRD